MGMAIHSNSGGPVAASSEMTRVVSRCQSAFWQPVANADVPLTTSAVHGDRCGVRDDVPLTRTSGLAKISSCTSSGNNAAMKEQPAWVKASPCR